VLGLVVLLCLPAQASTYPTPFTAFSEWRVVSRLHTDIQMRFREMPPEESSVYNHCRIQIQFRNQGRRPVDLAAGWRFRKYSEDGSSSGHLTRAFMLSLPAGSYKSLKVISDEIWGGELPRQIKSCQGDQLSRATVIER
jgi:hypothetical protein